VQLVAGKTAVSGLNVLSGFLCDLFALLFNVNVHGKTGRVER
jgi:hypothetical protein